MDYQPAKPEEYHYPGPENPFVLLGPTFHHADRIPAHAERIRNVVQLSLRALEHLPLLAQVSQHSPTTFQVLVELGVGARHEVLLTQGVRFPRIVFRGGSEGEIGRTGLRGEGGVVGKRWLSIGVFGGGSMMGPAAEEFGAVLGYLLFFFCGEINLQPRGLRYVEGVPDWGTHGVFVVLFQSVKGASIVEKVRSEVLDTLVSFFLLRGDEFFLGEIGVFVYGPRKGSQGSGNLACDRLFPD